MMSFFIRSLVHKVFFIAVIFSLLIHMAGILLLEGNRSNRLPGRQDHAYKELKIKLGTHVPEEYTKNSYTERLQARRIRQERFVQDVAKTGLPLQKSAMIRPIFDSEQPQDGINFLDKKATMQPPGRSPLHDSTSSDASGAFKEQLPVPYEHAGAKPDRSPEKATVFSPPEHSPPKSRAGNISGTHIDEGAMDLSYEQILPYWISQFESPPPAVVEQRLKGKGEAVLTIDRQGHVLHARILNSTDASLLDQVILDMIWAADPVIAVPKDYYPHRRTFSYSIEFALNYESQQ